MPDSVEVMIARIDERTEHIEGDIKELKGTCQSLSKTVNDHSTKLAAIGEKVKNGTNGLSRRQTAGIGGAAGLIASAAVAIIEYFRH